MFELDCRNHLQKKRTIYLYHSFIIEITILSALPFFGQYLVVHNPDGLAYALLFAMGLQNSLVTSISNAVVRTTHLTGLFTDLGIELSQLIFYKRKEDKSKLHSSIRLRLTIILFFFIGGVTGGIFYAGLKLWILLIASSTLVFGLIYDNIKFKLLQLKEALAKSTLER